MLTACHGSFSHKYDNLKSRCATTEEGALPLVSHENGRLQAWAEVKSLADFKNMAIRIVKAFGYEYPLSEARTHQRRSRSGSPGA